MFKKHNRNYSYDIFVDVSGGPCDTTYFGLVAINSDFAFNFEKEFEKLFPRILRSKVKGKDLSPKKLLKIIDFFDKQKIFFTSYLIKSEEYMDVKKMFPGASYVEEKVFGVGYYRILEQVTKKDSSIRYKATFCVDNQLDTNKARRIAGRLLESNKRKVSLTSAITRDCQQLKFADFVAAAHRNVGVGFGRLKCSKHYKPCPPPLRESLLNRVFISRSSKKKK